MDTDEHSSSLMKNVDMESAEKHLKAKTAFTLFIKFIDTQQVLEECGLIYDPTSGMYQSLEEGDRWKAEANPEGGVVVSPAPLIYENTAGQELNSAIGAGKELEEDAAQISGLSGDSPEGKSVDAPIYKTDSK